MPCSRACSVRCAPRHQRRGGRWPSSNSKYGSRHPSVVSARAQLSDVTRQIAAEADRIISSAENEYRVAISREQSITKSFEEMKGTTSELSQAQIKLRELERDATANRALYESFLDRFKETSQQESCKPLDRGSSSGLRCLADQVRQTRTESSRWRFAGSRSRVRAGLLRRSSIRDFAATIRSRLHWACRCWGCSPGGRSRDRLAKLPAAAQYLRPAFSYVRWFQGQGQGATSAWVLRGWFMIIRCRNSPKPFGRCAWASNLPMSIARPRSCW